MRSTYNNILFLGIGGGNDVFSTLLAAFSLQNLGWRWSKCSIAGVLSPFHDHAVTPTPIPGCFVTTPESTRTVVRRDQSLPIGFIDSKVAALVRATPSLAIDQVLSLSLKHGSIGLVQTFQELAKTFDFVVLVDVGGDCFYSGPSDTHVISPQFDAIVLRAFLDAQIPGTLFEAGPGTDGELDPEALVQALNQTQANAFPLAKQDLQTWEAHYLQWIASTRTGNTVPTTIQAFSTADEFLVRPYKIRARIGQTHWYHTFDQRIFTALCRQFFLLDPAKITNPLAITCSDPLDWFIKTQVHSPISCEANLQFWPQTHPGKPNLLGQFLTPPPIFPRPIRQEIIAQGIHEFQSNSCSLLWLHKQDLDLIPASSHLDIDTSSGRLAIITLH
jgi:hypothetical protein